MFRRRVRLALVLGAILLAGYLASGWGIGHFAAEKLAGRLHRQYGVELRWGWAWYRLPFGLALHDASIAVPAADGRQVRVFAADYVSADLSSLPRATQPVRIANLYLQRPVLHLQRQISGAIVQPHSATRPSSAQPAPGFVIEQAVIRGARIEYQNDLAGRSAFATSFPDIWINCSHQPGQPIDFSVNPYPDPKVTFPRIFADGSIDEWHQRLEVKRLEIAGPADDVARMLPTQVADRLRIVPGSGTVDLTAKGTVGLSTTADNDWAGALTLADVAADAIPAVPLRNVSVALSLHSSTVPGELVKATFQHADADTGGASLHIDTGTVQADASGWHVAEVLGWLDLHGNGAAASGNTPSTIFDRWQCRGRLQFTAAASGPYRLAPGRTPAEAIAHQVLAYPRDVAFRPPGFGQSFERITDGSISFHAGILTLAHLHAKYGDDSVRFDAGRVIFDHPHRQVELAGISSTIVFTKSPAAYPRYLVAIMDELRPIGAFGLTGTIAFPMRQPGPVGLPRPDYRLIVTSAGDGQFMLFNRAKVTAVQGSANLTPTAIVIPRAQGILFNGGISVSGRITPRAVGTTTFEGTVAGTNLQLPELAAAIGMKAPTIAQLAGLASIRAAVTDTVAKGKPWYDNLQGGGEFDAYNGAFALLPVIADVAAHKAGPPPTTRAAVASATGNASAPAPLTVDEAAGVFTLGNRRVTFRQVVISSPILGFQGTGSIGFDQSLNLSMVIAPLGDWRRRARQANLPIISDVAGDVLGAVQKVINVAQGSLINAVHVGGTIAHPVIQDTPAPAVTKGLAALFGQMLQPHQDHRLLDAVRQNK